MDDNAKLDVNSLSIKTNKKSAQSAILFVLLMLVSCLACVLLVEPTIVAISIKVSCWATLTLFIIAFAYNQFFMKLHVLSLPQIFLIVTFAFTSGLLMLHAFGLAVIWESVRWYNETYACIAAGMIILSVLCLEIGVCIGHLRYDSTQEFKESVLCADYSESLFKIGILAFFAAILILFALTASGGGYSPMLKSGYKDFVITRKQSDVRFFITSLNWLLPTSSLIIAAAWRNVKQARFANISALITVFAFLLAGDRGGALGFLLGYALTMRLAGKRYKYKKIILVGLTILLIIPIVHTLRQGPISETISSDVFDSREQPFAISAIYEMGTSFQTLMGTLMIVPEREDFRYGSTYLYGLSKIFPNLGAWSGSGVDRGLTTWITSYMRPQAVRSGHGGLGFLQIAEFYVQFGVFGILFGYILLGYFLMKWQIKCETGFSDRRWVAINGCLIYSLTQWIRNDILIFVRPVTWSIIFILVGVFILGGRKDTSNSKNMVRGVQ